MHKSPRTQIVAYGIAVLGPAVCLLARWPLWPVLGDRHPHLTCLPAVLISAYYGGWRPGLLALVLGALAAEYFLMEPLYSFAIVKVTSSLLYFLLVGTILGWNEALIRRRRAEESLHESERRWRGLTEALPQLVWSATPDGACDYFSRQWTEHTGVPESDLLGWRWLEVLHPDDREPTRRLWTDSVAGRGPYDVEYRVRRSDGEYGWFKTRGVPIRDGAGSIVKWFGTCTDITTSKQLEDELRQVNTRLDLAVRGSNVGVWDLELPDGDYRLARRHYVNLWEQLGYDGPPPASGPALEEAHPDYRARLDESIRRYLAGETAEFEAEARFRHRDGSYRTMLSRGAAVRDAAGKPTRFVGITIDITNLKLAEEALRESEERFRNYFELSLTPMAITAPGKGWLRVNDHLCELLGYSAEELRARTWAELTHPADLAADLAQFERMLRGEIDGYSLEKRFLRRDGKVVYTVMSVRAVRRPEGTVDYCLAQLLDITALKQIEKELRQAKEAAEAANRAKDEFLANVSHEIRTPMNAILGMTELVLDTELTADQHQCLQTVKSAADNLLGILNDLLDFAKIEAGKMELNPAAFSLRAAVGDTLRALAARAHKKGIELIHSVRPEVPDAVIGDAGRLRQVLVNLVGNALKFTDAGEVEVGVEVSGEGAGDLTPEEVGLRLAVRDTGIGIPKDQQARIFRAFEQEDASTTRRYGGTGLGLTIASRLVALMGGTITVDSAPGRGSTFAFTARFGRQPHPTEPAPVQPAVLLHDLPVLVIDDNATNRHILAEWLRGWQMQPAAAGDGLAALDALWGAVSAGRPYALVLLDARMPDTDGLALAAKIREQAELSATRMILLTSGDRPGDLARLRELRIDAHLLKPVQPDELLETIYRVMGRNGSALPAVRPTGEREQALAPAARPLRILVAEDNEFNAQLLEQLLGRRGHRVQLAGDGREALRLAGEGTFDLLLLDVHMPELDGFQVVEAIRERERRAGGHLPIIALTARAREEDRERCLAAGMEDFLAKPIQAADLWAAIDRVVSERPPADRPGPGLLDPPVLLAACGGDAAILDKICQTFRARLPDHLKAVRDALRDRDAPRLREAAHKLAGMVAAFSTLAGGVASELEDRAAQGQLEEAQPLAAQLEAMTEELMRLASGLSLDALRSQVGPG